LIKIN